MKKIIFAAAVFCSLNSLAQTSLALLSPKTLGCYEAITSADNADVLVNAKKYATVDLEKIVIDMCINSNAAGALKCLRDAKNDPEVMKVRKLDVNIASLDREYARLCSNTNIPAGFPASKDVDAVECFKAVMADPLVLTDRKKNYQGQVEAEIREMCTHSNGKGATTCFKNAMAEKERLYGSSIDYKSRGILELQISVHCRATRLK